MDDLTLMATDTGATAIKKLAKYFASNDLFFGHGTDSAEDEAGWLLAAHSGVDYASQTWPDDFERVLRTELGDTCALQVTTLAQRRVSERLPMAYLLGEAWFFGMPFCVDEHVLVPRSPIAELIAAEFHPWIDLTRGGAVLDLCTGSGCIGIAIASALPNVAVDASDICEKALKVAARNVERHELAERVQLIASDVFDQLAGRRYDLIVSNPPYVDRAQMDARAAEFRREPALGLAAGDDGLLIARRILAQAADHLTDEGVLIVEVGDSDEALQRLYAEIPFVWLEFESEARGVFVLSKQQLVQYHEVFAAHNLDTRS